MRETPGLIMAIAGAVLLLAGAAVLMGMHAAPRASRAAEPSAAAAKPAPDSARTPVLVELFTSEGCSSCPPADALLEKLDRTQPVPAANIVVLSEHVDYWDDLGWRDLYSSAAFSARQNAYAEKSGLETVYTPQMVVDGRYELVGSDERRALQTIEKAARSVKSSLELKDATIRSGALSVHVEAAPLPAAATDASADLLIAVADEQDMSQVSAGENDGRKLTHLAVLRSLIRASQVDKSHGYAGDVTIPLAQTGNKQFRVVAIVQSPAGPVYALTDLRLAPSS